MRFIRCSRFTSICVVIVAAVTMPVVAAAQVVSAGERDALVKLRTDRGGQAAEVDALLRLAADAAAKGLPPSSVTNKIREGLSKGHAPQLIESVVRQMIGNLDASARLLDELAPQSGGDRGAAVTILAEAIGAGVTPDEVRELRRAGRSTAAADIAAAGKGLSFIKEAKLPAGDGAAVIAEAVRQGFRSHEVLDLGREVKRREADYRTGRANLRALRDAIARGDRPEQLFRETRPPAVERPAARPPERPARPETPTRPEPIRPERPASGRD